LRLLSLAIALGSAAGAAAAATYLAMIALQGLIWTHLGDGRWVILPLTILGGVLIGWTRRKVRAPEIEAQIAAARWPGRSHLRDTFWIGLGAVFAVAFGGAIGPEAGIIAVTAQLSAVVALKLGRTADERRFLAEVGVSGALSGVYGSPAGGTMHSEAEGRVPMPVLFVAGLAGFAAFAILAEAVRAGALALMHLPRLTAEADTTDALIALIPAAAGAMAGALFLVLKAWASDLLDRHLPAPFWQPVAGGTALGVICVLSPLLLFSGHNELVEMLRIGQEEGPLPLVLLSAGKGLACAICIAAGWPGGVVFPMCFAGGALGAAALFLVPGVDPVIGVAAGMAAASAVGMARPLVAGLIMLFILGGGLAMPVFVGMLIGWAVLRLLPSALSADNGEHDP